jgi:hypothetical protein
VIWWWWWWCWRSKLVCSHRGMSLISLEYCHTPFRCFFFFSFQARLKFSAACTLRLSVCLCVRTRDHLISYTVGRFLWMRVGPFQCLPLHRTAQGRTASNNLSATCYCNVRVSSPRSVSIHSLIQGGGRSVLRPSAISFLSF